ncbi:hypothetical protein [Halomicrobium salinisoli]|uniref:hypothetical protein n=1 Tax=Halomicrobium salinisoli TaxID=2878391 RepID=UPI001CEFB66B|nr:hypothetical protein [Halomicrobium salinisoli]
MQSTDRLRTIGIALAALAVAAVAFSGGAAAQTTDGGQAGICMIGADSPCNGDQWDGGLGSDLLSLDSLSEYVDVPDRVSDIST